MDVDSHFQEPVTWLRDVAPTAAQRCPGAALLVGMANFVGKDPLNLPGTALWLALEAWARGATLADVGRLAEDEATPAFFTSSAFDS